MGLGVDVRRFAGEDGFEASGASVMADPSDRDEQPPDDWPDVASRLLRYAAESFVSYGLFDESEPTAHAGLAGTVLRSEWRRIEQTGQGTIVARVRTTGFEADICMAETQPGESRGPATRSRGTCFSSRRWTISRTESSTPGPRDAGASGACSVGADRVHRVADPTMRGESTCRHTFDTNTAQTRVGFSGIVLFMDEPSRDDGARGTRGGEPGARGGPREPEAAFGEAPGWIALPVGRAETGPSIAELVEAVRAAGGFVGGEALFDPRYEPEMRRFLIRALEMEGIPVPRGGGTP